MTSAAPHLCSSPHDVPHEPQTRLRCRIYPVSRPGDWRPAMEPDGAIHVSDTVLWSARGLFVCVIDRRGGRISAAEQSDGQAVRSHRRRVGHNGACPALCRAHPILRRSDHRCWISPLRRQASRSIGNSRAIGCPPRCSKRRATGAEYAEQSAKPQKIPVGCEGAFSPISSPRLAHIVGRCMT